MNSSQAKIEYADELKKCIQEMQKIKETPIVLEALGCVSDFGKILNQNIESTDMFYFFKGSFSRIYRLTNDLKEYNLKKGDYIYPDLSLKYLGNHLEVFHGEDAVDENGNNIARKAKIVLDLYGKEIESKTMIALGFRGKKDPGDNEYWWRFKGKKWRKIDHEIEQIIKIRKTSKSRFLHSSTDKKFCCDKMKSASEDICCPVIRYLDGSYGFAHCEVWYCPFCGTSVEKDLFGPDKSDNPDFCCETMECTVNYPDDGDQHQIVYQPCTRRYFFSPIRWYDINKNCPDEEEYPEYDLQYCLYCGKKLPETLLEELFSIVEYQFCVDRSMPMLQIVKYLPREFVTNAWWKNRKIPLDSKISQVAVSNDLQGATNDCKTACEGVNLQQETSPSILEKIFGALTRFLGFKKTPEKIPLLKFKDILTARKILFENKIHPCNTDFLDIFHNEEAVDESGKSLARKAKTVLAINGAELYELKMLATGFYNIGGERKFFKQLVRTMPFFMVKSSNAKSEKKIFCCQDMQSNCSIDSNYKIFWFDSNANAFYFAFLKCWFCVFCGAKLSCQEIQCFPQENNLFCCQSLELKRDNPYPRDPYKITYQCWSKKFLLTLSSYGLVKKGKETMVTEIQIYFCMFCGQSFSKILEAECFNESDHSRFPVISPMEAQLQILQRFHETLEWWK